MKVAIAGFGVEGQAALTYWQGLGHDIIIADERSQLVVDVGSDVELVLGPDAFSKLTGADLIIRSPGVNPAKLVSYGDRVWSSTREFLAKCPAPIIGVTGTKGKGTTASFIFSILESAGVKAHLVGNIGVPALSVLSDIEPSDVIVYELSSFQLWDTEKSPHIAVVLGIEPDHLDVHHDFAEYLAAKANIVKYQEADDLVIFNKDNSYSRQIAEQSKARKIEYPFDISGFVSSIKLPGKHNIENASAAIAAVSNWVTDEDAIRKGLGSFTGLPHRLKFVREVGGVKFFDDSIATTPGSAIAAMYSFSEPKILILGGSDKGADYGEIVTVAHETGTKVLSIGKTGHRIFDLCQEMAVEVEREDGLMDEVVPHAFEMATSGGVVILSPASASFDQYKNYADRGNKFISAVQNL